MAAPEAVSEAPTVAAVVAVCVIASVCPDGYFANLLVRLLEKLFL
jgi:hypothetical protein